MKEERSDFAVGVRVGSECGGEGGYTFDDTKWLAGQLQGLGIDYWHTQLGFPPLPEVSSGSKQDGGYLRWSRELKEILKMPVLTPRSLLTWARCSGNKIDTTKHVPSGVKDWHGSRTTRRSKARSSD